MSTGFGIKQVKAKIPSKRFAALIQSVASECNPQQLIDKCPVQRPFGIHNTCSSGKDNFEGIMDYADYIKYVGGEWKPTEDEFEWRTHSSIALPFPGAISLSDAFQMINEGSPYEISVGVVELSRRLLAANPTDDLIVPVTTVIQCDGDVIFNTAVYNSTKREMYLTDGPFSQSKHIITSGNPAMYGSTDEAASDRFSLDCLAAIQYSIYMRHEDELVDPATIYSEFNV